MAGNTGRTVEDVEYLIEKAKVDINGLAKVSQTLISGENMIVDDKSVILLELNPTLLESLKLGQEFTIRGDSNEPAVLCTKNQTFDLEEAQTSNSLLALSHFSLPNSSEEFESGLSNRVVIDREVSKIFHFYYEVKKCKPRLVKLRKLLEENPYQGPEYENENTGTKFTFECLLDHIQASEEELKKGLDNLRAFLIDGFYRVLDYDYKCRVVNFIFNLIDSNSYPINEIPKSVVLDTLEELVPRQVIEPCFEMYAEPVSIHSDVLYQLKEDQVCQFFAEILLRSAGKFHLQEFLESWQKSIPEGLTTRMTQLKGLALTDKQSKPESIFYYPVWNLPEDISERFDTLFRKRANWAYEDIKPYVEDLVTESLNVNALLTKYARGSMQKGIKMYNSKHPIK